MSEQHLAHAKYLCNLLATHRHDQYKRVSAPTITSLKSSYLPESIKEIESFSKLTLTESTLGNILLKYFEYLDIFDIGENAINLVNDIKSNEYLYKWISTDLKAYCATKLLVNESTHMNRATPDSNAPSALMTTTNVNYDSLINSSILEKLNEKLDRMDARFNLISNACITSTSRNDHFSELESNLDKLQKYKNSIAINRSYAESKVFPKALSIDRFPVGIYPDPKYKMDFAALLGKFQLEILDLNHQHVLDNIKELENKVSGTLDVIKLYDDKFDDKYKILKKQSEEKLKASFKISNEKFQSLLTASKTPRVTNTNQDNNSTSIIRNSSTSRPTQPKPVPLPQRVNNKSIPPVNANRSDNRPNLRSYVQSSNISYSNNNYSPLPRHQSSNNRLTSNSNTFLTSTQSSYARPPSSMQSHYNGYQSNSYQANRYLSSQHPSSHANGQSSFNPSMYSQSRT